jgi:hypothetical protein
MHNDTLQFLTTQTEIARALGLSTVHINHDSFDILQGLGAAEAA